MATDTANTSARKLHTQQTHYLRKAIAFNTAGASAGVKVGTLPAGAEILQTTVKVKAAFNAGTTNVLTVGKNSTSYNDIVAAGDVDESSADAQVVFTGADLTISADSDVYVKFAETGDAATTGSAIIIIEYVPNNDQ